MTSHVCVRALLTTPEKKFYASFAEAKCIRQCTRESKSVTSSSGTLIAIIQDFPPSLHKSRLLPAMPRVPSTRAVE